MENVSESTRATDQSGGPIPVEAKPPHHHFGLALIAVFKLIKGVLLLAAAIGLLKCVDADLCASVEHCITVLRMDPDSRYFQWLLAKVAAINPHQLKMASAGSLLLTEGIGLWFERRWAEYLTVIATSSFIPIEVYELFKRPKGSTLAVLAINLAIVWYLVRTLRREYKPQT